MPQTIVYSACPCCYSTAIYPALSAVDYTVSKKRFEIFHCEDCTARFTQHVPDAASIAPYYQSVNYVSHSDTQKGLVNRLYHFVRNYTLKGKRNLVCNAAGTNTGTLLDVGAGTGAFANTMKTAGWSVTALEPDSTARANAFNKYGLTLEPPEKLFGLADAQFDVITMWHVLEHVHDLHGYLDQFYKLIKPGGKLIIAVPNYTSRDAKAYGEFWAAYDVPRHLYHFSPRSMEQLGRAKGFTLDDTKPMWFDSFYVSMLSEQYRNEGGNLIGAFWNGMLSNLGTLRDKKRCSSVIYIFSK